MRPLPVWDSRANYCRVKSIADFFPHLHLITLINPSMEDLPADVMVDILSRLPVKTIIHCKCVCKEWRSLVLDTSFVNLHLSRSPTGLIIHHNPCISMTDWNPPDDPGILKLVEIEDKVDQHHLHYDLLMSLDLNLAPILQNTPMQLMCSVNGLICLWQYSPKLNLDDTYICNPVTREYMILPRQRFQRDGFVAVLYGFGVSSLTGEYKVVRTFQREIPSRPGLLEAEVYTLGTGQWRTIGPVPVSYWLNPFHGFCGPFMNNHCHWIVSDEEDAPEKICSFDLDKETFQLFPSPPPEGNGCHHPSLAVLKGCLCKLDTSNSELTIWVMKEYGIKNSWHKEVVIAREISVDQEWPMFEPICLMEGLKDGSILMVFEDKLRVFDPRSETIEDTEIFDPYLSGLAYRPGFLKLQSFESERVHMF